MTPRAVVLLAVVAFVLAPAPGQAHTFPDHADPRVGHVVETPPAAVSIWFDGQLEPVFSTIRVEDAGGRRVDTGDGHVDPKDGTLLRVTLRPGLPPGRYRVFWSVVARDGHRTQGDYPFRIK